VDIAAPGEEIWSTVNAGSTTPADEDYRAHDGTSMAAPHVTGVVALAAWRSTGPHTPQIHDLIVDNHGPPVNGCTPANAAPESSMRLP
jgi:serine protease